MRLLFLGNAYPPHHLGGMEMISQEMAEWFGARGHQVRVLTTRSGSEGKGCLQENVERSLWPEAPLDYYRPVDFFLRRPFRERHNLKRLAANLREFDPDAVIVWGMWNLTRLLPALLEKVMPERVVYYFASYWPIDPDLHFQYWEGPARRWWTELLKKPLRAAALRKLRADGLPPVLEFRHSICVSRFVRDTLVAEAGIPFSSPVIYPCIPMNSFLTRRTSGRSLEGGRLQAIFVGRLVHDKGVHLALESLAVLSQAERRQVRLTIVGTGHPDYEKQLTSLVERNRLGESVRFTGQVAPERVSVLLAESDVFLLTSLWPEPFARTVLEAMAAGTLVIGAEVGGQPELLVHGENALTFEPGNVRQLAEHLSMVIRDRRHIRELARTGQEAVAGRFGVDRMGESLEGYLEELLSRLESDDCRGEEGGRFAATGPCC